jgi:hypothetical protein
MGMVFRLMIFLLMFNLAVGMLGLVFGTTASFLNDQTGLDQVNALNRSFSTSAGVPVEETSFWYRFLDVISLGFFNQIKLFLNSTIFSVPALLVSTHIIDASLVIYLNGFITLILIFGMFELITGRELFGR